MHATIAHQCYHKVYLEFWDRVAEKVRHGETEPQLLNIGFKWDPHDELFSALTEYICHPALTIHGIQGRLIAMFGVQGTTVVAEIQKILGKAVRMLARPSFIYMEATEQDNRLSFDLNIYEANLSLGEVRDEVASICRLIGVGEAGLSPYYEEFKYATVGHLSGGYDRNGDLFFTVYFEE